MIADVRESKNICKAVHGNIFLSKICKYIAAFYCRIAHVRKSKNICNGVHGNIFI